MGSINSFQLTGRLGANPAWEETSNGKEYVALSIPLKEGEETRWIKLHVWNEDQANFCMEYLSQGSLVGVTGMLRAYQMGQGKEKRNVLALSVFRVEALAGPREHDEGGGRGNRGGRSGGRSGGRESRGGYGRGRDAGRDRDDDDWDKPRGKKSKGKKSRDDDQW